jgi:hypothetical protein
MLDVDDKRRFKASKCRKNRTREQIFQQVDLDCDSWDDDSLELHNDIREISFWHIVRYKSQNDS